MTTIFVKAPNDRPDFRQIVALLNFENVDTDGDSDNPASRTWTWLHILNRDEPSEVVDIYPKTESPLILTAESDYEQLTAAIALYLGTYMCGEICISETDAYTTPDALIPMCGDYDWKAAMARAANSLAAQSTLEFPLPGMLTTTDPRELFLGKVHNFTARSLRAPSLEEFLRSLWGQLQQHRDSKPSYELFAMLIEKALTAPPAPFNDKWKRYTAPRPVASPSFDDVEQTILFQVADLHAMAENGQIKDRKAYLGIASPSGNTWRVFDTCQFLNFAAFELTAAEPSAECHWGVLSEFLELGRLSEL